MQNCDSGVQQTAEEFDRMAREGEMAVQVRVPLETYQWLKGRAEGQERSLNWTLGRLISEARERDEQAKAA